MVLHVLDALAELELDRVVVVVGHGAEWVTKTLGRRGPARAQDRVRRAARPARDRRRRPRSRSPASPEDDDDGDVVVLPGDTPLLRPPTLAALVRAPPLDRRRRRRCSTAGSTAPPGYGRVVRDKDEQVVRIVEEGDASDEERDDRRGQHVDLLLPAQPSCRRRCAGSARPTRRASTT